MGSELTFHPRGRFVLPAPSCCSLWVWEMAPTFQEFRAPVPADRIYFKRSFLLPTVVMAPPVVVSHLVNGVLRRALEW